jgi:hypothetical protein
MGRDHANAAVVPALRLVPDATNGTTTSDDGRSDARLLAPLAEWVRTAHGEDALRAVLAAAHIEPDDLTRAGHSVSWTRFAAALTAVHDHARNDDAFMAACASGGTADDQFTAHGDAWNLVSPARAIANAISGPGRCERVAAGRGFVRLRYGSVGAHDHVLCLRRRALAVHAPAPSGRVPRTLREDRCLVRGDAACEYTIRWRATPRWNVIALAGVFGAIGAAIALGVSAAGVAAIAVVAAGAAYLREAQGARIANRIYAEDLGTAFRGAVAHMTSRSAPAGDLEPRAQTAPAPESTNSWRREGELWRLGFGGKAILLRHSRGLSMLAHLLRNPGEEIHVSALDALIPSPASGTTPPPALGVRELGLDRGDAGEVLDARAKSAYRSRLADLNTELEDAEVCNDPGRATLARAEIEALTDQLRSAVGLGGRSRKAASTVERMRVAVTRRIRAAITQVERQHPALGAHLTASVRTGYFCAYAPSDGTTAWET